MNIKYKASLYTALIMIALILGIAVVMFLLQFVSITYFYIVWCILLSYFVISMIYREVTNSLGNTIGQKSEREND